MKGRQTFRHVARVPKKKKRVKLLYTPNLQLCIPLVKPAIGPACSSGFDAN